MIRACEKNDFTMVAHFMEVKFRLEEAKDEDVKFRINDLSFKDKFTRSNNFVYVKNDQEVEFLKHIRNFQATCTPAFLIAKFRKNLLNEDYNFDPVIKAFLCIEICKSQENRFHEYADQFRKVQNSLEDFLGRQDLEK